MAFQKSVSVRNAELDAIETTVGTSPTLVVFSGAEPANCAAADPSGTLATIQLPSDWMVAAGGGTSIKLGTWSVDASASGTIASWRVKQGSTCHLQGNTSDMTFNNTSINSGQTLTVTSWTITAGNA